MSKTALPSAGVIFAHGLDETGCSWEDCCSYWAKRAPWIRFRLPTAQKRPMSIFQGELMHSWFDIQGLDEEKLDILEGMEVQCDQLISLVKEEHALVSAGQRLFVGGFSQGGAMTLTAVLREANHLPSLAGMVCLSSYLPGIDGFITRFQDNPPPDWLMHMPVLLCHGNKDEVISLHVARHMRKSLVTMGMKRVVLLEYPSLGHHVASDELDDVSKWSTDILPTLSDDQSHG